MGRLHRFKIPPRFGPPVGEREVDSALAALLALLWVASVYRVAVAAAEREVFGVEASLAFVCVFVIPSLGLRAWRARLRGRTERRAIVELSWLRRRAAELRRRRCGL